MSNRKFVALALAGIAAAFIVAYLGYLIFGGSQKDAQSATVVEKARPISDVNCGHTYQFDQIKRFRIDGQVVVNFHFGGEDRWRQPQYIVDRNVIGQSTEIRKARRVDSSLAYSTVTVLCLSDHPLEGHKASNIQVVRYKLDLRRPLVHQSVIPEGGTARR